MYLQGEWGWENQTLWDLFDMPGYTIMQYTWLKDKNWKEIYEGDILEKYTEEVVPIDKELLKLLPAWSVVPNALVNWADARIEYIEVTIPWIYHRSDVDELTICWNIYENPELLSSN